MKYYISLLLALLLLTGCGQTKLAYSIPATAPELVGTALPLQESE
jgi:PBP1b-binding outer membrane lipoprotein LpoB